MAIYATLAHRGFFSRDLLATYTADGGKLAEHPPANLLPGIEAATGSLGHGLPIACGHALAARIKDVPDAIGCLRCFRTANATKAPFGKRPCLPPHRTSSVFA